MILSHLTLHARLSRAKNILALVLVMTLLASLVPSALVSARPDIPVLPNYFYGSVYINGGLAPQGTPIGATVLNRSDLPQYTTTVDANGMYGIGNNPFYVPAEYENAGAIVPGARNNDQIQFYVNGTAVGSPATFKPGDQTLKDLELGSVAALTVVSISPANNATNVSGSAPVFITFSRSVTLVTAVGITMTSGSQNYLYGSPTMDGATMTIPHINFGINGSVVTVVIPAGAVVDSLGRPNPAYSWSFTAVGYVSITVYPAANGAISPSDNLSYPIGSSPTFTFTPNSGFAVKDVLVDGLSVGPVTSYTFPPLSASHTLQATFDTAYVVTAWSDPGGMINPTSPTAAVIVANGNNVTFTITPYLPAVFPSRMWLWMEFLRELSGPTPS